MIDDTDVLVGMHGAGLSHVLFLPLHAAMIELVPSYYGGDNDHFANLAVWRKIVYRKWINLDRRNEMYDYQTSVPVEIMDRLLTTVVGEMCGPGRTSREQRQNVLLRPEVNNPGRGNRFRGNEGFIHFGVNVQRNPVGAEAGAVVAAAVAASAAAATAAADKAARQG